ncbi:hypothetical protein SB00610_04646 [Klebsiella quasipneumoniae subsp. similipneumoniae]|nr:hypothetical protein SB00610_04646 [Klebsiella quasipneumoniae subsp. similipneumoniae]
MRQKGILLAFIEAMHFVNKQNRSSAGVAILPRALNGLADLFHPGGHRRDPFDIGAGITGDNFRQGSLAGTRRPPEDHRMQVPGFDRPRQGFARRQQVLLANILR